MANNELFRIIDANFNRAKEGLRVAEDISRYVWNEKALTRSFKDLRHNLTEAIFKLGMSKVLEARNVNADVGRPSSQSEFKRRDISSVFSANLQRVKESLRVLEEVSKLLNVQAAESIKTLRYRVYVLEQKAVKKS